MDPITLIVTALVAGAAAGLQPTAAQAVKDAYAALKALIQRKYGDVGVPALEKKPASEAKQASVAEDLSDGGAAQDAEALDLSKALLDALQQHQPQQAKAVGVDFEEIEAAFVKIKKVRAAGTGVSIKKSKVSGGIEVSDVDAGVEAQSPNP